MSSSSDRHCEAKPRQSTAFCRALAVVCFAALAMTVGGCGYTLSHRLKDTFADQRGIFVPVFENHSEEVGVERVFTNALIRELQSRGEILMSTRENGGLELFGTLTRVEVVPTAWSDRGIKGLRDNRRLPSEVGIEVALKLVLMDPKEKKVLWQGYFTGRRRVEAPLNRTYTYEAPSAVAMITQSIAESRYSDVARDIMRDVYDEMVEIF